MSYIKEKEIKKALKQMLFYGLMFTITIIFSIICISIYIINNPFFMK